MILIVVSWQLSAFYLATRLPGQSRYLSYRMVFWSWSNFKLKFSHLRKGEITKMNEDVNCNNLDLFINIDGNFLEYDEECTYAYIEDGYLKVHHPPEGPYPIVIPCPGIKLIVNGRLCTEPIPVFREDVVSVHVSDELLEGSWTLTISKDGLEAVLHIEPTVIIHRKLADKPPSRILELELEEWKEYKCPLTWDELIQELTAKKIRYGIDWEKCNEAIRTCEAGKFVIAKGDPPKTGRDGRVELLFKQHARTRIVSNDDETIDFRKRYIFTSVEAGDVLAIKYPPEMGDSGTSVTGNIIVPSMPRDINLCAGEGATLTRDGRRVIATRSGRPTVRKYRNTVKVSVIKELVHTGDVDLSSGNISFKGDILILGNVTENMSVEASQNIIIDGLVSCAKVSAFGSIFIKGNIISSVITAGKALQFQDELLPRLNILSKGLKQMAINVSKLLSEGGYIKKASIGPIVRLLLEGKYNYLIETATELCKDLESMFQEIPSEDMREFIYKLKKDLINFPLTVNDLDIIEKLAQQADNLKQMLAFYPSNESSVIASSVQNSAVIATGDIHVLGSGCYISQIQAGKKVSIRGVVRGGEIFAGSDVYIGELGSIGGSITKVIVSSNAMVKIRYAHANSLVVVGGNFYRFHRDEENVKFWLDNEGTLRFSNF